MSRPIVACVASNHFMHSLGILDLTRNSVTDKRKNMDRKPKASELSVGGQEGVVAQKSAKLTHSAFETMKITVSFRRPFS